MSSSASHDPLKPLTPQQGNDTDSGRSSRGGAVPSSDNQPTVISNRPPIPTSQNPNEDSARHLEVIQPGTRLGDIELTEHIGGGGMGQVYKGEDKRLGRPVAVKVLSRDQASDQEAVRRFLNEAKSAARLNHQHIAQVYSAGESEEHPYIVFEYVQGANLRTMLEEHGPLTLEEALSYTLQIADALAHAADRRIVHRDVKPSNVLIAPNGQAKLIDLGLARISEPGVADGDLTASGVTLGTFDYISPEQARDPRNADSRSDIYSLGCTLFYMLAGRPPFPEGTVLQKLLQHQGDTPPDVCQFRPDLPEEVGHVLGKMMAKDPRRRYPDSARLMEALLTLADMIGLQPTGPTQAIWLPPQESRISVLHRQTPWLAPSLTLACLILGLHLLWSNQEQTSNVQDFVEPVKQIVVSNAPPKTEPSGLTTSGQPQDNEDPVTPDGEPSQNATAPPSEGSLNGLMRTTTTPLPPLVDTSLAANQETAPASALPPPYLTASFFPVPQSFGISMPSLLGPVSGNLSIPTAPASEAKAAPTATTHTTPEIPLVITPSPQGDRQYSTIGDALAANPDANLIELRYDGRGIEKPISITGRQLTIRKGPDNTPILAFEAVAGDPVLYPRDMIQISNGELVLEDIAVELDIPRKLPSDSWALIRLSDEGRAIFRQCSLRIQNARDDYGTYHQDVAFFRATPHARGFTHPSTLLRKERKPDIELVACIACGEASLVRVAENTPLRMKWQNGLLATTEPAFVIDGSRRKPTAETRTEIAWKHVTAVTSDAMISVSLAPHQPHLVPINFADTSCILSARSLIQAEVVATSTEVLPQLTWTSEFSVPQKSSTLLSITNATGSLIEDEHVVKWLKESSLPEAARRLIWQPGAPVGPMHSITLGDFRLNLAETGVPLETTPPGFRTDQTTGRLTTESPGSD